MEKEKLKQAVMNAFQNHIEIHYSNGKIVTGLVIKTGILPDFALIEVSPVPIGKDETHRVDFDKIIKVIVKKPGKESEIYE